MFTTGEQTSSATATQAPAPIGEMNRMGEWLSERLTRGKKERFGEIVTVKRLGLDGIRCISLKLTNAEARMCEISENLHRAELKKLERDELVAEWIELAEKDISSQTATKLERGRPESGVNAAARELGIDKDDAHRAVKVASLSNEAKDAARDTGLDDNRSALLAAAREPTTQEQVAKVIEIAQSKAARKPADPFNDIEAKDVQVASLMSAWNKAGKEAREEFLRRIEAPVMDRKFGN